MNFIQVINIEGFTETKQLTVNSDGVYSYLPFGIMQVITGVYIDGVGYDIVNHDIINNEELVLAYRGMFISDLTRVSFEPEDRVVNFTLEDLKRKDFVSCCCCSEYKDVEVIDPVTVVPWVKVDTAYFSMDEDLQFYIENLDPVSDLQYLGATVTGNVGIEGLDGRIARLSATNYSALGYLGFNGKFTNELSSLVYEDGQEVDFSEDNFKTDGLFYHNIYVLEDSENN